MVSATEVGETLLGSIEYSTDLFDEASIRRMAGHFQTILESIVENPQQRVSELELLTPDEQRQLVVDWNETALEYEASAGLHELFEVQVARTPRATALVYNDERLSYEELNERANQLAHYLRGLGVGPETLVGVLLERSPLMIVAMLGVLKSGGAYVPLDISYPLERLQFTLEDARAHVLLTQALGVGGCAAMARPDPTNGARPPHSRGRVCLDREWPEIACERTDNPSDR